METVKRGDIWLVSFSPARGSEQDGIRPAVIIQNDIGNQYSPNTIIVAVSTKTNNPALDVCVEPNEENGLSERSFIKANQMLTISQSRLIKKFGKLSLLETINLDVALKKSLSIS
ncbi:MAG: type II toxin-antitoxin system PemK/MazF family toxin [Candidatus Peregrinibacteria bacterium]